MKKDVVIVQELIKCICDKNYADASTALKETINEKIKARIRNALTNKDLGGISEDEQV